MYNIIKGCSSWSISAIWYSRLFCAKQCYSWAYFHMQCKVSELTFLTCLFELVQITYLRPIGHSLCQEYPFLPNFCINCKRVVDTWFLMLVFEANPDENIFRITKGFKWAHFGSRNSKIELIFHISFQVGPFHKIGP